MEELKIVGWTSFDGEYPTKLYTQEEVNKIVLLIQTEIYKNGYEFTGNEHQNAPNCVPVLSDGTCFRASMRCWGSIMAGIMGYKKGVEFSYMDYYMNMGEESIVLPESKEIEVKPVKIDDQYYGYTTQEDVQLLGETITYGMPFMTTDKVLKTIYEAVLKEQNKG